MSFSSCRPAKLELGCWPDHAVLLKCPSAEEVQLCVTNEIATSQLTFLLGEEAIVSRAAWSVKDRVVKKNLWELFDSFEIPGELQSWHLRTDVLCLFHGSGSQCLKVLQNILAAYFHQQLIYEIKTLGSPFSLSLILTEFCDFYICICFGFVFPLWCKQMCSEVLLHCLME